MLSGDCPGATAPANKSALYTVGRTQREKSRVRNSETHKRHGVTIYSYEMLHWNLNSCSLTVKLHIKTKLKRFIQAGNEPFLSNANYLDMKRHLTTFKSL